MLFCLIAPVLSIHCDASETGVAAIDVVFGKAYAYNVDYNKPIFVKEFEACALAFRLSRT